MSGGQLVGLLSTYSTQEPSLCLLKTATGLRCHSCPFYVLNKTVVKLASHSCTMCLNYTDWTGTSAETVAWNRLKLRSHTKINDKHAYQTSHFLPDLRFRKQCCWQFNFCGIWHFVVRLVVFRILKTVVPSFSGSCHPKTIVTGGKRCVCFIGIVVIDSRQLERMASQ